MPENIEMFLNFVTDVLDPDEINTIIFRIGWNYEFSSYPELIDEDALSKAEVRKIVKHCTFSWNSSNSSNKFTWSSINFNKGPEWHSS